jgi:hypothetical protein
MCSSASHFPKLNFSQVVAWKFMFEVDFVLVPERFGAKTKKARILVGNGTYYAVFGLGCGQKNGKPGYLFPILGHLSKKMEASDLNNPLALKIPKQNCHKRKSEILLVQE